MDVVELLLGRQKYRNSCEGCNLQVAATVDGTTEANLQTLHGIRHAISFIDLAFESFGLGWHLLVPGRSSCLLVATEGTAPTITITYCGNQRNPGVAADNSLDIVVALCQLAFSRRIAFILGQPADSMLFDIRFMNNTLQMCDAFDTFAQACNPSFPI